MREITFKEGGRNHRVFEAMWRFDQGFWFKDESPERITNLCQWIRVVIIWPFFQIAAFCASVYALYSAIVYCQRELADPVVSADFWSYVTTTVLVIVALVVGVLAWVFIKSWMKARQRQQSLVVVDQESKQETPWYTLVWEYLIALKQQVCPVIRYTYSVNRRAS